MATLGHRRGTWAFSSCGSQGLLSSCRVRASHCGGFCCCEALALDEWASLLAALGLNSCSLQALEFGLSSSGAWAELLRGMSDLPRAGIKLVSTDLEVRFLIERPRATTRDDHQGHPRATIFQADLMPENGALVISVRPFGRIYKRRRET